MAKHLTSKDLEAQMAALKAKLEDTKRAETEAREQELLRLVRKAGCLEDAVTFVHDRGKGKAPAATTKAATPKGSASPTEATKPTPVDPQQAPAADPAPARPPVANTVSKAAQTAQHHGFFGRG